MYWCYIRVFYIKQFWNSRHIGIDNGNIFKNDGMNVIRSFRLYWDLKILKYHTAKQGKYLKNTIIQLFRNYF